MLAERDNLTRLPTFVSRAHCRVLVLYNKNAGRNSDAWLVRRVSGPSLLAIKMVSGINVINACAGRLNLGGSCGQAP
jgi:hypothetical protein